MLYSKYRPQRFSQVVGQKHVTDTLSNEVVEGRVASVYLFSGPRGTGKTTTARLLSKAINCPNLDEGGEPCCVCVSCIAVADSSSIDVSEIDAASYNKVGDIRDLRESISTSASEGGYKRVVILDEAHMLSKAASTALLKILEAPPEHVLFVLATTEPYSLLDTIRSICQRFDFQMVSSDIIADLLERVSNKEGYKTSPEGLYGVAEHAGGSVRDSLTYLERVASLDGSVTEESIKKALGVANQQVMLKLADLVSSGLVHRGLLLVSELRSLGVVDVRRFAVDALSFFRGVFLAMYMSGVEAVEDLVDAPSETVAVWYEVADKITPKMCTRAIDIIGGLLLTLRDRREEWIMLDLAVIEMIRPEPETDIADIRAQIENLETVEQRAERILNDIIGASLQVDDTSSNISVTFDPDLSLVAPEGSIDLSDLSRIWPQLMAGVKNDMDPRRGGLFRESRPGKVEGDTLVFVVSPEKSYHLQEMSSDEELKSFLAKRVGELLQRSNLSVVFRSV